MHQVDIEPQCALTKKKKKKDFCSSSSFAYFSLPNLSLILKSTRISWSMDFGNYPTIATVYRVRKSLKKKLENQSLIKAYTQLLRE